MSEKKKKRHHHHTILPYIATPLIYVLISLVIVVPIGIGVLNYSVNLVHKAQPSFPYSVSEIELNDSAYKPNFVKSGTVARPKIDSGDKIGEIKCKAFGLEGNVYYGENRVSFRKGAGMKTDVLPGDTGVCEIYGERAGVFSNLDSVKVGDKITLDTNWGEFVYSVADIKRGTEAPEETMPQGLMLVTSVGDKAFSNFNEEKLYVLADIESGPQLEEAVK